MTRHGFRRIVLAAAALGVLAAGAASAEERGEKQKKPETVSGTLKLRVEVTVNAAIPDGTEVSVNPSVNLSDGVYAYAARQFDTIKVARGKASYTLTVPYKWEVASKKDKIRASAGLFADYGAGSASASFSKQISIPKNGKTTEIVLSGAM